MTDKLIIRSALTENYTVIPNALLNDTEISGECLAMMVYLLSKPSDWQLSVKNLMKRFGWGRDKTYQAIAGLIERGYVIKNAQRNEGKFNAHIYFIYDTPQISPLPEIPYTEKPDPVNQEHTKERDYSSSVLQRNESHKTEGEEMLHQANNPVDDHMMFENFWAEVAHKQAKDHCKKKFLKAAKTVTPEIIIKAYRGQLNAHRSKGKDDEYFRRPLTWLNQKAWLDPFEAKDIADTRAARAKGRVRNWQNTGYWHDNWGFPPDHPGALEETKEALRDMEHGEKKQSKGL